MVNWGDPETFWLNVTNAALGIVTAVAFLVVAGAVFNEVLVRVRKRIASAVGDIHTLHVPALGETMADGGERVRNERKKDGNGGGKKRQE